MILTVLIAIPLGMLAAYRSGTITDKIITATAFGSIALPDFALAIILSYWVGVKLGWLPTSGYTHPSHEPRSRTSRGMILPAISLAVGQIAAYMRLLRSDMIATLQEDYILMAKSKGITEPARAVAPRPAAVEPHAAHGRRSQHRRPHRRHDRDREHLRHTRHGSAALLRDLRAAVRELQSLVAVIAIGYVLVNVAVDVLYTVLDPRIRDARALA